VSQESVVIRTAPVGLHLVETDDRSCRSL